MRRAGTPIEIGSGGAVRLNRLSLTERAFDEAWLQEIIHQNPSVLPIDDFRPTITELTSLGREIATPAGPIDNLFVDTNGTLVVVEAKLWRNPEARQEVTGQVIDYAAALSRWGYGELDNAVRSANAGRGLLDLMADTSIDEALFVDGVERSLRLGDMVLLIVGDGIRESLESIADLLAAAPHLGFTFGLVELAAYETPSGARLVVPSVVPHSVEITRATVRVEAALEGGLDVRVAALANETQETRTTRKKLDADSSDRLLRDNVDPETADDIAAWRDMVDTDPRMRIDYATASMIVRLQPSEFSREFTGLLVYATGTVGVGHLLSSMRATGIPIEIAERFATETAELVGAAPPAKYPDTWGDGTGRSDRVDIAVALHHRDALMDRMRRLTDEIETSQT